MRKTKQEMLIMEDLIKRIMVEHDTDSPAVIKRYLQDDYQKNISKTKLLEICNKYKTKPSISDSSDLTVEYEDHPEIISINQRIKVLEGDFKIASSISDKCRLSNQIDSARESKAKIKKILKETDLLTESKNKVQYIIKFGEPSELKVDKKEGETKNE
jgi:hypothetical protein